MKRRSVLGGGGAAVLGAGLGAVGGVSLARPAVAATASMLRYVPSSNLTLLDPIWSTAYISLCHGYAVFDALYGLDARGEVQPQMAEGHGVSDDGLVWTIRLREGLKFHDGSPVLARDVAASMVRWCARQSAGQVIGAYVDQWVAADDRTVKVMLKQKLPTLALLMGTSVFPAFVMPERLAKTEPSKQVTEMVGSGPFRFKADEFISGSLVVYEKFAGYVPRSEAPSATAGGKVAKVDRLEWKIIPDAATAVGALQRGEVDWMERPIADLLPSLKGNKDIKLDVIDPSGWTGFLRFNCLQPPFDNVAVRQAVMMAVDQLDYLRVATGDDASSYQVCKSFFPCGTEYGNAKAGDAAMPGNIDAAKAALAKSGYKGERVVLLNPADNPPIGDFALIAADTLKKIGMNVDMVTTDWGTVTQRRASKAPVEQGGWSVFVSLLNGPAQLNPAVNFALRGQGERGYFGWYKSDAMEALATQWLMAGEEAQRKALAAQMQQEGFRTVPLVPLGQYVSQTAYRTNVTGVLKGPAVLPWNVSKS